MTTYEEAKAAEAKCDMLYGRMVRSKSRKRREMLARAYVRALDRILDYKRNR